MRKIKDSGVAWLGEIPENWQVVPSKALFRLRKEKAAPGDRQLTASQQHGIIYQDDYMALTGNRVVTVEKDFSILKRVEKGDFVISMRSFQGGLEYSENAGSISSAYVMLIPDLEYVVPEFYKWLFKSPTYITALQCTSNLIRDGQALRYNNFVQVPLCIIPKDDQKKIAGTLGEKCQQIDTLIINVQAQIEKLKAYKQSLITEVVTKGLDPDAPMKDSGVEWIGKMPCTWELSQLGTVFSEHKCKNIGMQNSNLLSLSYGHIVRKNINTTDGLLPENFEGYNIIDAGDIVLRLTDLQNDQKSLRVGLSNERGIVTSAYITLRKRNIALNSRFFYYQIYSYDVQKGFYGMGSGVRQGLNYTGVRKLILEIPPESSQKEIADYLDVKCAEIDKLIALKQSKIEKLEQYKRSLIYEYVTGKKEVS